MELLLNHPKISEFLTRYPTNLHQSCLLGLCLIGLKAFQSHKMDFDSFISTNLPSIPTKSLDQQMRDMKQELALINASLRSTNISLPTDSSIIVTQETPEKEGMVNSCDRRRKNQKSHSIIDIADKFLGVGIVKDILQKEMLVKRLQVSFRKKWEEACTEVSINNKDINS